MNKQFALIATAALACVGSAHAQNAATIYGVLDAGVLNISTTGTGTGYIPALADGGKNTGFRDGGIGGSNLGIKGERDMGNGNKAYFQLQGSLYLTNGTFGGGTPTGTTNFNQLALLGFSGKAGDVKLGRQVSPMYVAFATTDARGARNFGSTLTTVVGMNSASRAFAGAGNTMFGTVYNDNSITYTTPKFVNTTVSLQHVFGNVNGNTSANTQDAATAIYSDGGLRLSALYYNGNGNSSTLLPAPGNVTTANNNRLTSLGALYTTGPWTMSFATFDGKIPSGAQVAAPAGATSLGSKHMTANAFGLTYAINADLKVSGGFYDLKDKSNTGNKAKQTAINLDYTMFKDTTAYVQAASTTNVGDNMNLSPLYGVTVAAGKNNTATMVGVRYTY